MSANLAADFLSGNWINKNRVATVGRIFLIALKPYNG
jgi:hypothetical protein